MMSRIFTNHLHAFPVAGNAAQQLVSAGIYAAHQMLNMTLCIRVPYGHSKTWKKVALDTEQSSRLKRPVAELEADPACNCL